MTTGLYLTISSIIGLMISFEKLCPPEAKHSQRKLT